MQAHPLSIPAARIPFQSPAPSHTAQPLLPATPSLGPSSVRSRLSSEIQPDTLRPSPSIPRSGGHAPGIAQGSGLAHDAGNLLGALALYCDLLRVPGVLRPEHRHYATELGLISSRSSELIRRLLVSLSPPPASEQHHLPSIPSSHRANQPSATPPPEAPHNASRQQPTEVRRGIARTSDTPTLDHACVLRNLAPVLQRIAAGTATVWITAPSTLPPLDLPTEALERIAVNLVRNAVEAIRKQQNVTPSPTPRPPGEIRVALSLVAGRLQLTVEDNGPGIPPPIAAAFMSSSGLPSPLQRGLGHRIVHDLVTSSGGQIAVRTRPGHGTLFSMKWPLPLPAPSHPPHAPAHDPLPLYVAASLTTAVSVPALAPTAQKGPASC